MANFDEPVAERERPQVAVKMDDIEKASVLLDELSERLVQRLDCVLTPSDDRQVAIGYNQATNKPQPPLVPLANRLNDVTARLYKIAERITSAQSRLEL